MFEFELEEIEKEHGGEEGLKLKFEALDTVIRPILKRNKGIELEDILWIYHDSADAVKSVLFMKEELLKVNE